LGQRPPVFAAFGGYGSYGAVGGQTLTTEKREGRVQGTRPSN
jgi:hypothetical protein